MKKKGAAPFSFAPVVERAKKRLGLKTDAELAGRIGVSQQTVTRWRRDESKEIEEPSLRKLAEVAGDSYERLETAQRLNSLHRLGIDLRILLKKETLLPFGIDPDDIDARERTAGYAGAKIFMDGEPPENECFRAAAQGDWKRVAQIALDHLQSPLDAKKGAR